VKYKVLAKAKRPYVGEDKRRKFDYQCSACAQWFKGNEVEVDHIHPCGSLKEYADLEQFVETLFCSEDNLRVVCKTCHKQITKEQKTNATT
jgi:hypothetical protein